MPRSLKVFSTAAGFYTAVVAAPSQKAALAAWGVREDLFAKGLAHLVDEPGLIAAARAQPGTIVRVPIGAGIELISAAVESQLQNRAPSAPPVRAPADRSALAAIERALTAATADFDRRRGFLAAERADLENKAALLELEAESSIAGLTAAVDRERQAYESACVAGGGVSKRSTPRRK